MSSVLIKGKLIKGKLQPVEFGADCIDNTAPVNKIIDELQNSNSKAASFYNYTIRQRRGASKENNRTYHFSIPSHPLFAFTDNWNGDLSSGYFKSFYYKSSMPKMITQMCNIKKTDPVTEYMKTKSDWTNEFRNFRQIAVTYNMLQKYEALNEDVVECPKHLVDMAAHADSNPDPYFDSSYNWYYAGNGNLQLICIDWIDYLLHSQFSTVYVTRFSKINLTVNNKYETKFNCGKDNNILETVIHSAENIIALRTKHKVYILKIINSEDKLQIEQISVVESELPFTGISFDQFHTNILYVTGLDNKVSIINLNRIKRRTVKLQSKMNTLVDNWSTVISSERSYYTHVARNSITTYDKRTNCPGHTWTGVRDVTDEPSCNDISVAKHCAGKSTMYFATDHHLFLMDMRYQNKKPKLIQRWNHGMQCVPCYMASCNFESNKELICLSSQWCEDTCVVPNYIDSISKDEIRGVTIPFQLPSMLTTLSEARQKSLCFSIYKPIDPRLCTSLTGNVVFEQGDNYIILQQNSLGDISCHKLFPEHMRSIIDDDSIQNLHDWGVPYQTKQKQFEVSTVQDVSKVWKMLKVTNANQLIKETKSGFNDKEIFEAFESEELDAGLLDIWINNQNESPTAHESSLALNLHYETDSE